MATVTTSELVKAREAIASFSMIEHKGILARLVEEGSLALGDFTRDPRGFIREIFSDDTKDLQRSKRIRAGLALGLAIQIVLTTAIALAGWHRATATSNADSQLVVKQWIERPLDTTPKKTEPPSSGDGSANTPKPPKGTPDAGSNSGGSGNNNPLPPTAGIIPRLPNPAVIPLTTPGSPNPALPVPVGIEGPPTTLPPDATIGMPNGDPNTKSAGPGTGGNIGTGKGPGAGENTGPGGGKTPGGEGVDGGTKGGPLGSPNGITPTGPIDFELLKKIPDSTGLVFTRRVRPIVTDEAKAGDLNYVLLYATFNANGTITDIEIRQSNPLMDEQAKEAVRQIKFRPATIRGVPVTLRRVPIKVDLVLGR